MSFIFGKATTYSWDLKLFEDLGLKPFSTDSQDEIFVGQYKLPEYDKANVKIWVTCMPAQFWKFEIETEEDKKYLLETGSGALTEYWPTVVKFMEGMIVCKEITNG